MNFAQSESIAMARAGTLNPAHRRTRHHPTARRHFILLIDGTWVSASRKKINESVSNIYKINLCLPMYNEHGEAQVVFYYAGLGSETESANHVDQLRGGALGEGLERQIEEAYTNLVSNFDRNDQIYIFGFSRGAVSARVVADLISTYGVLKTSKISRYPEMWSHYLSDVPDDAARDAIRGDCNRGAMVQFLGVFDTVLGPAFLDVGEEKTDLRQKFFTNREVPEKVKAAVQILAMHETRAEFDPVAWSGISKNVKQRRHFLEQIWMPGVHSDIGGGYTQDFLSDISLLTMLDRLHSYCRSNILFDSERIKSLCNNVSARLDNTMGGSDIAINDERKGGWEYLEKIHDFFGSTTSKRCPSIEDQNQYYHDICEKLQDRHIPVHFKSQVNSVRFSMESFGHFPRGFATIRCNVETLAARLDAESRRARLRKRAKAAPAKAAPKKTKAERESGPK
jgi:uncharacterized protein (DUF2235 family)